MDTQGFLKRIQEADQATKRRILFAGSALAMLVVIVLWLMYFNNLVVSSAAETNTAAADQSSGEDASFWGTMRRGGAVLIRNITGGAEWLGKAFQAPREYIVRPIK